MYNRIAGYKQYYKSLVMLGVPIIIGQLGAIITGLADTIMVGQHSTEELAAASFVNNVINAFIIMGTGFSYNLTPLIGQNLAINKKDRDRRLAKKQSGCQYDHHLIIDSHLTGDLPKPGFFRPARRALAIDKTLFRSLISLDHLRDAL